ncbi:hypothetical protein AWU67_06820 [Microterricola viridarii]|uniref:Uncharacterized protein n=2 Tax=Microterricola viridarii TaxID=412690 RepID=A0A0X8E3B7_9MICO|nr:hypothetical protein AWU67_06820 [Microterricola viridarii]
MADWDAVRDDLANYQPTSLVDYPASHIARVKLSGDVSLEGKQVVGQSGLELEDKMFVTLAFSAERGWRIWGVGNNVEPHQTQFPIGEFSVSPNACLRLRGGAVC